MAAAAIRRREGRDVSLLTGQVAGVASLNFQLLNDLLFQTAKLRPDRDEA